jgi:hypothetical protein
MTTVADLTPARFEDLRFPLTEARTTAEYWRARAELAEADADLLHELAATWALELLEASGKFPTRQALLRSVISQHQHAVACRQLPPPSPDFEGDQP